MDLYNLLPVVILHAYALGIIVFVFSFAAGRTTLRRPAFALLLVSFAAHTLLLLAEVARMGETGPARGVFLQMLAWCLALAGFVSAWKWRSDALLLVILPVIPAVFVPARLLGTSAMPALFTTTWLLSIGHIVCLFLSFAFLTLAFAAGVLFLVQEKSLKSKTAPSDFQKELPALMVLDKLNALAVHAGFPLFTVGMLSGLAAGQLTWGSTLMDFKEWISLLAWSLFALLYHERLARGRRGRKPAILAICIFAVCIFSLTVRHSSLT